MKRSLSYGLGLFALIASVGYADAQLVRHHSPQPIRSEADAKRICPALCAAATTFGHRYNWPESPRGGGAWSLDECDCSIKH
jgi:hypothetical protein